MGVSEPVHRCGTLTVEAAAPSPKRPQSCESETKITGRLAVTANVRDPLAIQRDSALGSFQIFSMRRCPRATVINLQLRVQDTSEARAGFAGALAEPESERKITGRYL